MVNSGESGQARHQNSGTRLRVSGSAWGTTEKPHGRVEEHRFESQICPLTAAQFQKVPNVCGESYTSFRDFQWKILCKRLDQGANRAMDTWHLWP